MTEFLRVIASRAIFAGYLPSFEYSGTLLGTLLSAPFFILHDYTIRPCFLLDVSLSNDATHNGRLTCVMGSTRLAF